MATSNFWSCNSKAYYVFGLDHEDQGDFDFELDCLTSSIREDLNLSKDKFHSMNWDDNGIACTQVFAFDSYKDEVCIDINIVVKYWYYNWAFFDRDISHDIDMFNKTTQKKILSITNRIEKILKRRTTSFVCTWRASNGEAFYQKIN